MQQLRAGGRDLHLHGMLPPLLPEVLVLQEEHVQDLFAEREAAAEDAEMDELVPWAEQDLADEVETLRRAIAERDADGEGPESSLEAELGEMMKVEQALRFWSLVSEDHVVIKKGPRGNWVTAWEPL